MTRGVGGIGYGKDIFSESFMYKMVLVNPQTSESKTPTRSAPNGEVVVGVGELL